MHVGMYGACHTCRSSTLPYRSRRDRSLIRMMSTVALSNVLTSCATARCQASALSRQVSKISHRFRIQALPSRSIAAFGHFEPTMGIIRTRSQVKAHRAWAIEVISGRIPAPVDSWPSSVHEQAIFETMIRRERTWGSWPEINQESACYNIMCDHSRIHPNVAREKGLGLIVKVSNPPCIGLVNGVVYDKIRGIEQCQRRHGSSAAELLRKAGGLCPEDWLTITLNKMTNNRHLTLEATISNTLPKTLNRHYKESVPTYMVRGVWYTCLGDEPCIGAEVAAHDSKEDYSAILI
jgi:hypothetical protein